MAPAEISSALPESEAHTELSDGSTFYPLTQTEFTIHTIAHSAAMACRFGGQCRDFYSVAQHSVLVSYLMAADGADPLEGLLHDASEAFVLDMPTPVKKQLPDYYKLEKDLERRIRVFYKLPELKTYECDVADKLAMYMEAYDLIPSQGTSMKDDLGVRESAFLRRPKFAHLLVPLDWRAAKYQFLKRYLELTPR